jgi:hypothetical protein
MNSTPIANGIIISKLLRFTVVNSDQLILILLFHKKNSKNGIVNKCPKDLVNICISLNGIVTLKTNTRMRPITIVMIMGKR